MEHSFTSEAPPAEKLPIIDRSMKADIFDDEPFETYLADTKCLNASSCIDILKSPHHYSCRLRGLLTPEKEPEHFRFGRIAHMAILEPQKFLARYVVEPTFVGRTKDGKETMSKNSLDVKRQHEEWRDSLPDDAIVITQRQQDELFEMTEALICHPEAANFFKNGKPEVTLRGGHEVSGMCLKIRPDYVTFRPDGSYDFFDVKSTRFSPDSKYFDQQTRFLSYHVRMALYWDVLTNVLGRAPDSCALVPVLKEIPSEVGVVWMTEEAIARGRSEYNHAIKALLRSMETGEWPRRINHGRMLEFPAFAENEPLPQYAWRTDGQRQATTNEAAHLL